jgi:beta-lactamase regulating signal transducer with metallopeptidase domain
VANDLVFHLVLANLAGAAAVLVVLALRGPARAQFGAGLAYALWLIVPAAMLASLFPARTVLVPAPVVTPDPMIDLTHGVVAASAMPYRPVAGAPLDIAQILIGVWLAGVVVSLILLAIGQRRAIARFGRITVDADDARLARASNPSVGPALIGVVRPRVVIPDDFEARFEADERAMILAHERTHLARGHASINGLTALLKAVNWFNPLGHVAARYARVDQELACDAAVVERFPGARKTYAQALLKTQLAFMPLPLGCDWPVRSASLLEKRIEMLAHHKPGRVRLLGGAVFVAALTAGAGLAAWSAEPADVRFTAGPAREAVLPRPSLMSAVTPSSDDGGAKTGLARQPASQAPAEPRPETLAQGYGPAAAQAAVPPAASPAAGPADLDRYVGAYQITRFGSMIVTRQGDTLVLQPQPGPPPEQYLRGSDGVWTGAQSGQRVRFDLGPDGRVIDLSFEGGAIPGTMMRRPDGEAEKRAAELAARVKAQTPDPRTEGVIRELIRTVLDGSIDFDRFFGERAAVQARAQVPGMQSDLKSLGDLKSLAFKGVGPQGGDQYVVTFANGQREFRVILDAQGRIDTMNNPSG